ncbi:hypothetical protein H920_06861 [Fukomys damarensis]|uniref:Uncharacterized protein n=1 Tax=Fukomys damarensis TaxID=885580 RepID=A0A091DNH8_FUKDA|nr:hypothetical protein H920_06861 [Fukomys damarensis]
MTAFIKCLDFVLVGDYGGVLGSLALVDTHGGSRMGLGEGPSVSVTAALWFCLALGELVCSLAMHAGIDGETSSHSLGGWETPRPPGHLWTPRQAQWCRWPRSYKVGPPCFPVNTWLLQPRGLYLPSPTWSLAVLRSRTGCGPPGPLHPAPVIQHVKLMSPETRAMASGVNFQDLLRLIRSH